MNKKIYMLFLLGILCFSISFSRSFYFESEHINITVLKDGLLQVSETLSYYFDGCYIAVIGNIPLGNNQEIFNFKYDYPSTLIKKIWTENNIFNYDLEFPTQKCNTIETITISYETNNVIDVYTDTSSLHYILWSNSNPKLKTLTATITLPNNVSDFWIHNKVLNNNFSINNNVIHYSANNIDSKHWVEIQVLFDPLINTTLADVHDISMKEEIEKQEDSYKTISFLKNIFTIIMIISPFLLFYFVYYKYGQEIKLNNSKIYERNPPTKHSPAMISAILNSPTDGKPTIDAFIATIFDLARKNIIKIKEGKNKKEIIIKINEKNNLNLTDYENKVIYFLNSNKDINNEINWDNLKKKLKKFDNAKKFQKIIKEFKTIISKNINKIDYFNNEGNKKFIIYSNLLIAFFTIIGIYLDHIMIIFYLTVMFITIVLNITSNKMKKLNILNIFFIIIMILQFSSFLIVTLINVFYSTFNIAFFISAIIIIILNFINKKILGRWTNKGRNIDVKWNNFKRFLKDFSELNTHPPRSIIIWEQFLVYAIVLGVADNVIKVMKLKVPNFSKQSRIGFIYYNPYLFSSMRRSLLYSNMMRKSGRSSSGFGGGSGGFGGGFGGGSRGAR